MPPLTALRAFAALAEAQTAQAAGAKLNVSHAAISQQIKALETHLGLALVNREGRSLALTSDGLQLADAALRGFAEIERSVAELTGVGNRRPLQISLTPSFAANWLLPRLPRFRESHAESEIMMNASPKLARFEQGGVDLAIRFGNGNWSGVDSELILPTEIVVVAAPELVRGHEVDTPDALRAFHWLVEEGESEANAWLETHGATGGARGVTYLSGNMMLDAARQGQGVVSTARLFVEDDIAAGRLQLLFENPQASADTGYHLVTPKGRVLRSQAKAFSHWLKREAKV